MPPEHIIYIPTIFTLGFLFGFLTNQLRNSKKDENLKETNQTESFASHGRTVSGQHVFLTFVLLLLVFAVTHFVDIPWSSKAVSRSLGGLEIFDKKPSYSSDEVYNRLQSFSTEGIEAYKRFTYTIDILFPAVLFTFLFVLAYFVKQRMSTSPYLSKILVIVPIIWLVHDLLENMIVFRLLSDFPTRNDFLAGILGFITAAKFVLLFLSILIPSAGIVIAKSPSPVRV